MATIKDIAKLANVSYGTVSNVLNKKGNVSAEKIRLVENAAKELGFVLNAQAKELRSSSKSRICVIVPRINQKRYCDLIIGIENEIKKKDYTLDFYYTNDNWNNEEEIIKRQLTTNPRAIVLVSSDPNKHVGYLNGTEFIMVERPTVKKNKNFKFFGFDFKKAGIEVAKNIIENKFNKIAIFSGTTKYANNLDFSNSIKSTLDNEDIYYKEFIASDSLGYNLSFDILRSSSDFDCIVTTNQESADFFTAGLSLGKATKPVIYSITSYAIHHDDKIERYEMNYKYAGKLIGDYINLNKPDKEEVIIESNGFSSNLKKYNNIDETEINFLTIHCPTTDAIEKLLPLFTYRTKIKVNMIKLSYDEAFNAMKDDKTRAYFDIVRLDMVWLHQFHEYLLNLEKSDPVVSDVIKKTKWMPDQYFVENDNFISLPLDTSVQMFYYRKDLFEDQLIKREFLEKYKRPLDVPNNYQDFKDLLMFFTKSINPSSKTKYATAYTCGSSIIAMNDIVFRLSDAGLKLFDATGRAIINDFEHANILESYKNEIKVTKSPYNNWWNESANLLSDGEIAMLITFSNHASLFYNYSNSKVFGKIGYAKVPGNKPMLGGGVLSIPKTSKKYNAVMCFISWLYEDKISAAITYLGGFVANESILKNVDILEVYPWLEDMKEHLGNAWRRLYKKECKHFDQYVFEKTFGTAILNTVLEKYSAKKSLDDVQIIIDETFNNK